MEWRLDGSGPIWEQIAVELKTRVAAGELRPGERLSGVRELALEAGVNPNTMQRALSELERQGLLYSQRTAGRFVTEDREIIGEARRELAEERVQRFLGSMDGLGYTLEEIIGLLKKEKEE